MGGPFLSDLGTISGDEYYMHWGIEAQPGVKINRGQPIYDTNQYAAAVAAELQKTSPEYFTEVSATLENNKVAVIILPSAIPVGNDLRLQVWIVEDNINAEGGNSAYVQLMGDGSSNVNYVHNHVFRASLTPDLYGDRFAGLTQSQQSYRYEKLVENTWNTNNLSLVVFLWTEQEGVLEVKRVKIAHEG